LLRSAGLSTTGLKSELLARWADSQKSKDAHFQGEAEHCDDFVAGDRVIYGRTGETAVVLHTHLEDGEAYYTIRIGDAERQVPDGALSRAPSAIDKLLSLGAGDSDDDDSDLKEGMESEEDMDSEEGDDQLIIAASKSDTIGEIDYKTLWADTTVAQSLRCDVKVPNDCVV
jgi:hypothetical protein